MLTGVPIIYDPRAEHISADKCLLWACAVSTGDLALTRLVPHQELLRSHVHASVEQLIYSYRISSVAAVAERRQPEMSQSLWVRQVLDGLNHSRRLPLYVLKLLLVAFAEGPPNQVSIFQEWSHQGLIQQWQCEFIDVGE